MTAQLCNAFTGMPLGEEDLRPDSRMVVSASDADVTAKARVSYDIRFIGSLWDRERERARASESPSEEVEIDWWQFWKK